MTIWRKITHISLASFICFALIPGIPSQATNTAWAAESSTRHYIAKLTSVEGILCYEFYNNESDLRAGANKQFVFWQRNGGCNGIHFDSRHAHGNRWGDTEIYDYVSGSYESSGLDFFLNTRKIIVDNSIDISCACMLFDVPFRHYDIDGKEVFRGNGFKNVESIDTSALNTSKIRYMCYMFEGLANISSLDLSKFDTSSATDMRGMFSGMSSVRQLDLSSFDTSKVGTDSENEKGSLDEMFLGCTRLESVDVSSFDTRNVSSMSWMFEGCSSLKSLDLSSFTLAASYVDTKNGMALCVGLGGCELLEYIKTSSSGDFTTTLGSCGGKWQNSGGDVYELRAGESFRGIPVSKADTYYPIANVDSFCGPNGQDLYNYFDKMKYTFTGSPICPKPQLFSKGKALREGVDYTLSYSSNINSGQAQITINGKGLYEGTRSYGYHIDCANIRDVVVKIPAEITVKRQGSIGYFEGHPKPVVTYNGKILTEGQDYSCDYENNSFYWWSDMDADPLPKTAYLIIYSGALNTNDNFDTSTCKRIPFKLVPDPYHLAYAKTTSIDKTYLNKSIKASITLRMNGKTLKEGRDYTIKGEKTGKAIGTYRVTATGKGRYRGKAEIAWNIVPKGTSIKGKMKAGKKSLTVKWAKPSKSNLKQTTGYQVRYSMEKSMKGAKTKTVKASSSAGKKCSLKLSKLKGGKKYYVQIRTYKKVGGKTYYSSWSKAKTVKVKK